MSRHIGWVALLALLIGGGSAWAHHAALPEMELDFAADGSFSMRLEGNVAGLLRSGILEGLDPAPYRTTDMITGDARAAGVEAARAWMAEQVVLVFDGEPADVEVLMPTLEATDPWDLDTAMRVPVVLTGRAPPGTERFAITLGNPMGDAILRVSHPDQPEPQRIPLFADATSMEYALPTPVPMPAPPIAAMAEVGSGATADEAAEPGSEHAGLHPIVPVGLVVLLVLGLAAVRRAHRS